MQQKKTRRATRESSYKGAVEEAKTRLKPLVAKTQNQKRYIDFLNTSSQVVVTGYSGTGKTYIAATHAANRYLEGNIKRIIVTRPNVAVGKDLGYFPGTLEEKIAPWVAPVHDTLVEHLGVGKVETDMKNGNIRYVPLSVMRGSSYDNTFILVDEAQNLTVHEMKMLLTRVGSNSQLVINGDIKQSDLRKDSTSGLAKIVELIHKHDMGIPTVDFTLDDIVRSDICKQWAIVFDKEKL